MRFIDLRMIIPLSLYGFATEAAIRPTAGTAPVLTKADWLQWFTGLAVVIFLILVSAWVLRRLNKVSFSRGQDLRILGGISVGTRERVILLQAGEKQLLLGVAPGRVETLHVFGPGELGSPDQQNPADSDAVGFADRVKQAMQGPR